MTGWHEEIEYSMQIPHMLFLYNDVSLEKKDWLDSLQLRISSL